MRLSTTLIATALAAAAPSLQAEQTYGGNAVIVNKCDFPLYLWSVDQYHQPSQSEYTLVAAKSNWSEPLRVPNKGCNCGVSIKLSKTATFSRPILQFEYTIAEASSVSSMFQSYDISFVDCSTSEPTMAAVDGYTYFTGGDCPAWDEGISIGGSTSSCPTMNCAPGSFCYLAAYFEPEPAALKSVQPVRQCPNGDLTSDIILVTCTSSDSADTAAVASVASSSAIASSSSPEPAIIAAEVNTPISSSVSSSSPSPTPSTTIAPKVITTQVVEEVVVWTTVVSTVYVDPEGDRVNEDGSAIERRYGHMHHEHHRRHPVRRHL